MLARQCDASNRTATAASRIHRQLAATGEGSRRSQRLNGSSHPNDWQSEAIWQRNGEALASEEAQHLVQRDTRERGHKRELAEAGFARIITAALEHQTTESPPRPRGVHEERADARRLGCRVEIRIVAGLHLIAPEMRAPMAPSAGGDERAIRLDDVVRPVGDELRVRAEHMDKRALRLRRRVVADAQSAH